MSAALTANDGGDLFDRLFDRRVQGYTSLSAPGQGEPSDCTILYTKNTSAEIDDLISFFSEVQLVFFGR